MEILWSIKLFNFLSNLSCIVILLFLNCLRLWKKWVIWDKFYFSTPIFSTKFDKISGAGDSIKSSYLGISFISHIIKDQIYTFLRWFCMEKNTTLCDQIHWIYQLKCPKQKLSSLKYLMNFITFRYF